MRVISKLYLMIHPTPRNAGKIKTYLERWEQYLSEAAADPEAALCVLSNSPPEMAEVSEMVSGLFGDRCFMDPDDWSDATKLKFVEAVGRAFAVRGTHSRDRTYGLWTDRNAIRWTEGLKMGLADRGFTYSPSNMQVFPFGAMWGGCMTKYAALMSSHLGVERTPEILPELCHDAGYSVAGRYLEKRELNNHVWAFLFQADNGVYFAQFMEGLRAAWERQKLAVIEATPDDYFIHAGAYNSLIALDTSSVTLGAGKIRFPVMDGYLSPNITVFCRDDDYDSFRQTMFAAEVVVDECRDDMVRVGVLPYQAPAALDDFC